MKFYFEKFEHRRPPEPITHSIPRETLWQFLATISLGLGAWYIVWRWGWSLNYNAMWFAIPLMLAETCAFTGLIIFTINLWKIKDTPQTPPPRFINECIEPGEDLPTRPISVDVFFPTYDEDPELVRLSIIDAKKIRYTHPIDVNIHVLDDGKRATMKSVARKEGVDYITRSSNVGFKAGNMRNGMERTSGDFIVICDADTRPFPTILEHTLGYFRDPAVAWVQTPQWFFDLPEGSHLRDVLKRYLWYPGYYAGALIEKLLGSIMVGEDRFVSDPQMFFDIIQRRRNWANASFCCGAGSIHRREAVMQVAMRAFGNKVDGEVQSLTDEIQDEKIKGDFSDAMKRELVLETEITPYKFHVSEDLYTSIVLHSDKEKVWKSVMHPRVESKMLSPQDLLTWTMQRFKYAGGTLDIAMHDNPLFKKGLSVPQKIMYGATFYSYFAPLWNVIFLSAPIIYLFTGIAPLASYSIDFYKHVIPFLVANSMASMVGTWGISAYKGASTYLSFFPVNLRALWTVFRGKKIAFPATPKDRQEGNFFRLIIPQFAVMVLTITGLIYAGVRISFGHASNPGAFAANLFWGLNNVMAMSGIVFAAFWKPKDKRGEKIQPEAAPAKAQETLAKT